MMKTPVVLIIFKRPDTTEKVFEAIRQAKPPKLFVIADGPRPEVPGEAEKSAAARAIIDRVDWDCKVVKNYSNVNLGCAKRVSSGLDWIFENTEEAIILEDDCVPHPNFFRFCEELLERYRDDQRIMSISGQNVQFYNLRTDYSYYFSHYSHCWGWATWSRAWRYYDFEMNLWSEVKKENLLNHILQDTRAVNRWIELLDKVYEKNIDSWAYRWTFSCWLQSGLSIISKVNLISNIGCGIDSTNIKMKNNKFANINTKAIDFPLKHPPYIVRNTSADSYTQKTLYNRSRFTHFKHNIKKIFKINP